MSLLSISTYIFPGTFLYPADCLSMRRSPSSDHLTGGIEFHTHRCKFHLNIYSMALSTGMTIDLITLPWRTVSIEPLPDSLPIGEFTPTWQHRPTRQHRRFGGRPERVSASPAIPKSFHKKIGASCPRAQRMSAKLLDPERHDPGYTSNRPQLGSTVSIVWVFKC